LSGRLPGLIDVHTHMTMDTHFDPYHELPTSVAKSALIGAHNAKVTLEAGKWADIIAVKGDPLADIKLLQQITFVMKAGVVYKHDVP
jgi:imidazolonepropionase-like amidohydrolase